MLLKHAEKIPAIFSARLVREISTFVETKHFAHFTRFQIHVLHSAKRGKRFPRGSSQRRPGEPGPALCGLHAKVHTAPGSLGLDLRLGYLPPLVRAWVSAGESRVRLVGAKPIRGEVAGLNTPSSLKNAVEHSRRFLQAASGDAFSGHRAKPRRRGAPRRRGPISSQIPLSKQCLRSFYQSQWGRSERFSSDCLPKTQVPAKVVRRRIGADA